MNMTLLTFGLVAFVLSTIALLMLLLVFNMEMLIINIKQIAANELNSLIRLINKDQLQVLISLILILNIMKVHRIITTIEVENDNSITSVELTKLHPTSDCILLAITNITTNGNAEDITKIYDSVNKSRLGIAGKLKSIARIINDNLDNYDYNVVADDNSTNEINDDLLL